MNDTPLSSNDLRPGSILGRYELLLPIAKGGMAQVWAARLRGSRGFQKLVAIKTILAGVIDNSRMEQMFLEEAQLASQIHHPNVVGTLELGEEDSALYLVMEWVDGESLSVVLAKAAESGGVPLPIAVNLIGQACQGLYAAHNLRDESGALLGLVHRDVSPQNLLVSFSGTAKLVDFGIAKATSKASGLTEAGEIKGKFAYMAPEQVRGHAIDARTDLFALGILLYLLTTGKHPFRGEHPGATVQNICAEHGPTPPSAFLPDYPAALEDVVLKSLAKDPERRFATANDMLTALEAAMPGPLEASFEVQVAEYLKRLFGARATERRAAIRLAQEHADRQRAESSSSISVGTLRAIAVDQRSTSSSSLRVPVSTHTLPSGVEADALEPRKRPRLVVAAASLLALAVVGGGILQLASGSGHSGEAAASSPVPAESLLRSAEPAALVSKPAPLASSAAVAAAEPAAAQTDAEDESAKSKSKRDRKGARTLPTIRSAPVVAASVATPAAAAAGAAAPPAAATAHTSRSRCFEQRLGSRRLWRASLIADLHIAKGKIMSVPRASHQRTLRAALPAGVLGLLFVSACVADQPGIASDQTGGTSVGGQAASAGSTSGEPVAGTSSPDAGGAPDGAAGTGHAGSEPEAVGGTTGGGSDVATGGTAPDLGEGGQMGGQGGEGGAGTTPVAMSCLFHTAATGDVDGAGGASPAATVVLQTNGFVGSYLTDAAGRTLYTYGADLPGDCNTPPVSLCVVDCLTSWPVFDAGSRVLGVGLDDAAFGAIDRGDGTWQTTYYGWPLYYYKSDLTLGQFAGQGKGKTWHAAELTPPSVVIMKAGMNKYLADGAGHTLYVSAADQAGTGQDDPVSVCDEQCLASFAPFREKHLSVVTSLEEADFSVFVRGADGLQIAYKGLPLYRALTDLKSGDTTGIASPGFTAAVP